MDDIDIPRPTDTHKRRVEVVACFGMAAALFASVLTLLGVEPLDVSLTTRFVLFRCVDATKCSIRYFFNAVEHLHDYIKDSQFLYYVFSFTMAFPFFGFVAVMLHFSVGAAITFALVSLVMPIVVLSATAIGAIPKAGAGKKVEPKLP